ncbi:MAG: hypothetical protein ACKO3V_15205 [Pirellula sp.]
MLSVASLPRSDMGAATAKSPVFVPGVRFAYPVLDIGQISDELLATDPFLQSILGLLKYSRRKDFAGKLEFLLRGPLESGTPDLHLEHLEAVVVYITEVSPSITVEKLEMTIKKIFQTQIEPGSIADQYLRRGRMQGLEEGRQEGRQEGKQEGRQEGMKQGILEGLKKGEIHLIQTLQEILGLPLGDPASFQDRSLEQLQAISTELRQQIRDRICPAGPF